MLTFGPVCSFYCGTGFLVTKINVTLADSVYLEILHSSRQDLEEAREILRRVERRELYKFLGETRPKAKKEIVKVMSFSGRVWILYP